MRVYAREKGYLPTEPESPRATGSRPAVLPPPPAFSRRPTPPPPPHGMRSTASFPTTRSAAAQQMPAPAVAHAGDYYPDAAASAPPLYLVFQNQKYLIDKEQFIIGRGSKSSDLPIRDGNISRKHAAVIRRNGAYFIKDLGSTNGIDFNGVRIDNKRIEEGDIFTICDYELRFTFR
jgi:FHA domain